MGNPDGIPEPQRRSLNDIAAEWRERSSRRSDRGASADGTIAACLFVLFVGPSGPGKTMAAELLALRLRLELHRVDLSLVVSKYIGETEKNLARLFEEAERTGAVLFFDEADALFGTRTEVKDSHDRYANLEIGYLLQKLEAHEGIVILSTNRREDIDSAFLRRVRYVVPFPGPVGGR